MQGPEAQLWVGLDMMCAHLVVPLLGEVCQQLLLDLGRLVASCTTADGFNGLQKMLRHIGESCSDSLWLSLPVSSRKPR